MPQLFLGGEAAWLTTAARDLCPVSVLRCCRLLWGPCSPSSPMSAPSRGRKRGRSPAASPSESAVGRRGAKRHKEEQQAADQVSVHSDVDGPVYDSCNEVRRKIRAFLRKGDTSIAEFLRALGGVYRQFMAMKVRASAQ